ncbi:MAG: DUF4126 domain-containing protein [Candidatus Omnitrophica bacterium]|nr:DUF4126 domain-containing protein [Candidatus Omnitrophota bacterium]
MDISQSIGVLFGSSWASGINLYMTVAFLGIAQRMHWISLPGDMQNLAHPLVIAGAIVLYAIEFVADKVPVVDHLWDSVHTIIRPAAGAALGYMAMTEMGPVVQTLTALTTGGIAASSHLTKATTRVTVNSTLVPGANIGASVAEDASVAGMMYMILKHPVIAGIIVIGFVIFAVWFLKKMFHLMRKVFSAFFLRDKASSARSNTA